MIRQQKAEIKKQTDRSQGMKADRNSAAFSCAVVVAKHTTKRFFTASIVIVIVCG